jgi:hypothetical protein
MLLRQQVKTVTHVVELPNFVQDRIQMHGLRDFLESLTTRGGTAGVRWRRWVRHLSPGKTGSAALPCDMFIGPTLLRRVYGRST